MCWEDVKINRNSGGNSTVLPISATSGILVGASPGRTKLIILGVTAGVATIGLLNPAVTLQGINISTTSPPVVLSFDDWGNLIQEAWFVVGTGAANLVFAEVVTPLHEKAATRE